MIINNKDLRILCMEIEKSRHACKPEKTEFCFKGLYGDVHIKSKQCRECNRRFIEMGEWL